MASYGADSARLAWIEAGVYPRDSGDALRQLRGTLKPRSGLVSNGPRRGSSLGILQQKMTDSHPALLGPGVPPALPVFGVAVTLNKQNASLEAK